MTLVLVQARWAIWRSYSRVENHAEIDGDPYGDTNPDELRGFCTLVLELTRGM